MYVRVLHIHTYVQIFTCAIYAVYEKLFAAIFASSACNISTGGRFSFRCPIGSSHSIRTSTSEHGRPPGVNLQQ